VTGQEAFLAGHCLLTVRYFEPCYDFNETPYSELFCANEPSTLGLHIWDIIKDISMINL
jgi:hypothetical protein